MVKRIHGNNGELLIKPLTGRLERFAAGSSLYLVRKREKERSPVTIETSRGSDRGPIVRLSGVWSRDEAKELFGASLFIPAADLDEPESGTYYAFQVEGCEVYEGEKRVGVVIKLQELPKANPYIEIDPGGEEKPVLIPFIRQVIKKIDLDKQRIEIVEGFLV